jgi:hypothetical protein
MHLSHLTALEVFAALTVVFLAVTCFILRRRAASVARWLEPMIARTRVYELRQRLPFDGLRETSLDLVLTMLTRYGTAFDPVIRIEGSECLPELELPRSWPPLMRC